MKPYTLGALMGAITGLFGTSSAATDYAEADRRFLKRLAGPTGPQNHKLPAVRTVRPPWPCNRIPRVRPKLQKLIGDVFAPVMECAHKRPLKYTKYGGLSAHWLACHCRCF